MLHLIFQSPLEAATLQRLGHHNAVLFLENAVLCLLKNGLYRAQLTQLLLTNRLFVLIADLETRGINAEDLIPGIAVIDYAEWVNLTTEYQQTQSWF